MSCGEEVGQKAAGGVVIVVRRKVGQLAAGGVIVVAASPLNGALNPHRLLHILSVFPIFVKPRDEIFEKMS